MNLTEREQAIFDFLLEKETATLTDLKEHLIDKKLMKKTMKSAVSTNQSVKYLSAKVASKGYAIERISGIGRGVVGVYKMTKIG
jgi:hypothetical protein